MNANKQKRRILSIFLALVLVLTAVFPATAATSNDDFMRVFHLDAGRKYFTVDQVKELIDAISAVGYTHMELAIGNEGLRLLLDDMSVTVGSTTYSSEKVSQGIKNGNSNYSHSGEWSQSEMDTIISYAASKHIEIIPLVNTPGHMRAILAAAANVGISSAAYKTTVSSGWWGNKVTKTSSTTVDLHNAAAVGFTQALVKKYVDYFASKGSSYFNIGADEYAADVHSSGSMGFGVMQSGGWYDDYVNYINDVAAIIKSAGMKPIAFNDGIYFNENDDTAFDKDIIIAYWIPSWGTYYVASPAYLVSKGHKILNTNDDWYYVIGRTSEGYGYDNAYNGVNNTPVTKVADGTTMSTTNLAGSMNCVWCDEPNANYESNKSNVMYFIETLAAKNPDFFVVSTHEHVYETTTVAPTCTEAGSVTTTCVECGESTVEQIAALGHSYKATVTAPTCTANGYTTYTCTVCGSSYTANQTAATGHTYSVSTVAATCEKAGTKTYTCTDCGYSYTETIAALGHNYKTVTVNATCEKDGSVTTTCTNCGDCTTEIIPATGHDYETVVVEATCEKDGSISTTCANCGEGTVEVIEALGHTYISTTVEATCTTDGGTTHTCTVCGDSYMTDVVNAYGHDYETVTVEATCEEKGSKTHTCVNCGEQYTEVIAALGHNYVTETVEATCETAGSTSSVCTVCGDSSETVIPALGHDYHTVTVEATCKENGSVTTTCANCGDSTVEVLPAMGHSYETVTVEATCEKDGSITTRCAHCGDATVQVIEAPGHNYTTKTVAATCTESGYTTYTCTTCGYSYNSDYTAAHGHSYTSETVEATCTADGYTVYTCSTCGYSYTGDYTSAHGHSYTTQESGNNLVYTCVYCGDSYSESLKVEYSYGKVTSFSSGNNYVITVYSNRKYYAVTHTNNTISVKQVTVSNNEITSEITEDMLWTYKSNKLSYTNNGTTYYMYAKSSNSWWGLGTPTLAISSSSSSSVSFSSSRIKIGSYYLRYSNGSVTLNRSSTTTYLFKQTEE